jgi:hypothetical protein
VVETSPTSHEIRKVAKGFSEYHISVFRNSFFEFLLQVSASMLIFAQSGYFPLEVFDASASKSID